MRTVAVWLLQALLALLAGCASLPSVVKGPPERALTDVGDTRLAQLVAAAAPPDRGLSGFRLLPEGETSFNARIALIRRAQKSIDVQYYLIQHDAIGREFLRELRDAARRGVRVRLLVDDLYTAGQDGTLAGLAAYEHVEVRLFNPMPSRAGSLKQRLLFSLHELGRINHRMHNKLFIADNSFAVAGGRNIAEDYFMHGETANFIDLDVLAAGPVVHELSAAFDTYWNSAHAYPVERLVAPVPPEEARRRFDDAVRTAPADLHERDLDVLGHAPLGRELDAGTPALVWAPARVLADPPDKIDLERPVPGASTVIGQTLALFAAARSEVDIVSPYFIPGERGMELMRAVGATEANGRLTLVTNSLGATDEPLVHAGYARYRLEMLKAGVRIYEVSPVLSQRSGKLGSFGRSRGRLHAKVALIDHHQVFIGSMNLDPRSAFTNTEVGLVIDSPGLVQQLSALFRDNLTSGAYRLRLAADGEHIEWVETDAQGHETVHTTEPDDDWWRRLRVWLLSPFLSEDLL